MLTADQLNLIVTSSTGEITNEGGGNTLLVADEMNLVAVGGVGKDENINVGARSGSGTLQIATGAATTLINNPGEALQVTSDASALAARALATAARINLSLLNSNVQVTNTGQLGSTREQSGGLADEGFIDPSLFEAINLYEVFGSGIRLPADQSEEQSEEFDCANACDQVSNSRQVIALPR